MELHDKAGRLPDAPGVYIYKDAYGEVLYVGKAKSLRSRVRSYFSGDRLAEPKTGTLISEARDIEYILVDNEKEALALENNLIKRWKPRFNVLLRDDKTYPLYQADQGEVSAGVCHAAASQGWLDLLWPLLPRQSGAPDPAFHQPPFSRSRPARWILGGGITYPCLQYHIHRCLGPCVEGLTTDEAYEAAVRNVRLFLEGRHRDLIAELRRRMQEASSELRFEQAAALRDLIATVEELEQKQKMAAAEGEDTDIFAYHAEPPLVAVNLFHLRRGRIVDRREYFWEDLFEFEPEEFFASLLKQVYLDQRYVPGRIHVPAEFEDRALLEELLSEKRGRKTEIHTPQRGEKKAMLKLVETNALHSFHQRFRVLTPTAKMTQEALQEALNLEEAPRTIECFDISHIQGTDQVASMVCWQDGKMNKGAYKKFIIKTVAGNDDFASMREVVTRRYGRLQREKRPFPGLVLIDGGIGQLHAAGRGAGGVGHYQPAASLHCQEGRGHLRLRAGE